MTRQVVVVAKAATASLAPFHDPAWEIWGVPWINYPRVDRLFELHSREHRATRHSITDAYQDGSYIRTANELGVPVYCDPSRLDEFENGIEYPLDQIIEDVGRCYFECSMSYQIAMAIYEKADVIGLWGVHMRTREEFAYQLPSVMWLIGLAEGRGIEVHAPPGSPLIMSRYIEGRYGVSRDKRPGLW